MSDKSDIVERLRLRCALELDEQYLCDAIECEAADEIERLRSEIARLREERRCVEGRVVISRETFGKVVAALSRCTVVANEDGEEWNDEEVIDARDSIRRDAEKPLPPGPEGNA